MNVIGESDLKLIEASLELFHKATNDTSKVNALNNICENMVHDDWEKYQIFQLVLIEKALEAQPPPQETLVFKKALAGALNNIGFIHDNKGNPLSALAYYDKSLKINEEIGNKKGMATSYNNIGSIHRDQGSIRLALEFHTVSLQIQEQIGNKDGIAASYHNIALVLHKQGDLVLALEYYEKSLKVCEELGNKKEMITSYNNIGSVHRNQNNIELALAYYEKSLNIAEELNDKRGMALSYTNIGASHKQTGNVTLALTYYEKSLKINEEIGDKNGVSIEYNNIAKLALGMGKVTGPEGALALATKSLSLSQEVGYPENIKAASGLLSKIYSRQGNFQKALEMRNLQIQMRDSLASEANIKAAANQKAKYEYEKQKALDDKDHEKQLAIEKEEQEKQQIIIYATTAGSVLIILFIIIYFRLRRKKNKVRRQLLEVEKVNLNTQLKLAEKEQEFLHLKVEAESKNVQTLSHELFSKQDFSANLIEKLDQLENVSKPELKSVELFIQNELDIKSTRALLQNQMGDLSSTFYNKLKINHSSLTEVELKLAAMVVMQMSNKEIAISKNMTSGTVRNAKYRLKKKLKLTNDEDLLEILSSYLS
mgnify:CR=1 FL=1